jgi:4-amino-4-deoxy-L-arabinose transferase-like glycosyltransferase
VIVDQRERADNQLPAAAEAASPSASRRPVRVREPGRLAEAGLVGAIALIALAFRLPHVALVPRFTDESLEVLWSLDIVRGLRLPLTNYDAYYGALFNYLVAGAFLLLGPSALAARLVVLITGLLTVLASWALARAWGGPRAGLIGGLLMAGCTAHAVVSSHIAWSNCTTPLFTTLTVWLVWLGVDGARPRLLPLAGLLGGLALQTHPLVATLLPGAAFYLVWRRPGLLRTAWPYLALVGLALGYANVVAFNFQSNFESLTAATRLRREYAADQDAAATYPLALASELLLLGRVLGGAVDTREAVTAFVLDPLVLLGSCLALGAIVWSARRGNWLPLLLTLSFLLLLPAVNPKFRTLVTTRYIMPLVPILLAAVGGLLATWLRAGEKADRRQRLVALLCVLLLALGPLPALTRYYQRVFATADTNERPYALAALVVASRQPDEPLVLDEAFGTEGGAGVSEQRALRYLLAFDDVPVRVLKLTPKRLEDELEGSPSLLVLLYGRQTREYGRLTLEPLGPAPERPTDVGLFRLSARS